jgi:hypothetical protein
MNILSANEGMSRMRSHSRPPDMPGIRKSETTASTGVVFSMFQAASPSGAERTLYPSCTHRSDHANNVPLSSSTTKSVLIVMSKMLNNFPLSDSLQYSVALTGVIKGHHHLGRRKRSDNIGPVSLVKLTCLRRDELHRRVNRRKEAIPRFHNDVFYVPPVCEGLFNGGRELLRL